jgi:hypothetical protein
MITAALFVALLGAAEADPNDRVDAVDLVEAAESGGPLQRLLDRIRDRPRPVREALARGLDRISTAAQILLLILAIAAASVATVSIVSRLLR